jgi:hypothetical protein
VAPQLPGPFSQPASHFLVRLAVLGIGGAFNRAILFDYNRSLIVNGITANGGGRNLPIYHHLSPLSGIPVPLALAISLPSVLLTVISQTAARRPISP